MGTTTDLTFPGSWESKPRCSPCAPSALPTEPLPSPDALLYIVQVESHTLASQRVLLEYPNEHPNSLLLKLGQELKL